MRSSSSARRSDPDLSPERAASLAGVLRALAHPLRLRIVALLCREDLNVNSLVDRLDARQAIVSQQLRILRMSRLVAVERTGGFAVYRLAEPRLRAMLRCMQGCSCA